MKKIKTEKFLVEGPAGTKLKKLIKSKLHHRCMTKNKFKSTSFGTLI